MIANQLEMSFDVFVSSDGAQQSRRLDRSLNMLQDRFDALPEEQRIEVSADPAMRLIEALSRVRCMEMAEEDVLGRPITGSIADLYDRMVEPGAALAPSLLRVAKAALTGAGRGARTQDEA